MTLVLLIISNAVFSGEVELDLAQICGPWITLKVNILDGLSSYAEEFRASLAISQYSLSFVVCFTGEYNTAEILAVVGHLIHICLPTLYIYGGKLSEQSYSDMVILQTVYHVNVPCSTVVLHSVAHGHRNGGKELWLLKLAFPLKPCESSKVFILSVSY